MEDLQTFYNVLLAICAGVIAIWGAVKVYKEVRKPSEDLKDEVHQHGEQLKQEDKRLRFLEESNRLQNKCLLQIMNHQLDGNHVQQLAEARDDMQNFLIEH